jgi:hypothetical protein
MKVILSDLHGDACETAIVESFAPFFHIRHVGMIRGGSPDIYHEFEPDQRVDVRQARLECGATGSTLVPMTRLGNSVTPHSFACGASTGCRHRSTIRRPGILAARVRAMSRRRRQPSW